MFLRTAYNYDPDTVSRETGLECSDPSLAQQQFKDECDINVLLTRFAITGQLPSGVRAPQYGDFSAVTDYHSALNAVIEADRSFMEMPADIRSRFNNDPGAFVEFCSDPGNHDEAVKLGLVLPTRSSAVQAEGASGGSQTPQAQSST